MGVEVSALLAERSDARKNKNWAKADLLRDKIKDKGKVKPSSKFNLSFNLCITYLILKRDQFLQLLHILLNLNAHNGY